MREIDRIEWVNRRPGRGAMVAIATAAMVVALAAGGCGPAAQKAGPAVTFVQTSEPEPTTAEPTPSLSPTPSAPTAPVLHGGNAVKVSGTSWWSWTLLDRATGQTWGSPSEHETSRAVSMIKYWLAALYLHQHPQPAQNWINDISAMIRDSNNDAAMRVFWELGGRIPVMDGMKSVCGVTGPNIPPGYWWASTWISPFDNDQLARCVADGRATTPQWTEWLLNEMRHVRDGGDFGIRYAFAADVRPLVAIKNGWNVEANVWYVNCLAVTPDWILTVESRSASFVAGRDACVNVTKQLMANPA